MTAQGDPATALFPRAGSGELAQDIESVAVSGGDVGIDPLWARPGILRRIAARIAETLPAGVDRVVGDEEDLALITAVSLHSGVPCAVVDRDLKLRGELYPTETVLAVRMCSTAGRSSAIKVVLHRRVQVTKLVTAVEIEPPADLPSGIDHCALFRVRGGRLYQGDE
ncbi:hypothetical protein [Streptomyces antimycoticus]|uniref:hypothetical protein n=1 Tax=Streptomyces antimycoticus TaxID=68175 RepID=UPI00117EFA82|nr:hypothetical protein [Streptomyces antimycoticus]